MSKSVKTDWREQRRQSARAAIIEAGWSIVGESGLAALSMRELANRAGITTPTLYAYFDSKNDIYDQMFAQSAQLFAVHMAAPLNADDPTQLVRSLSRRFVDFCVSDIARYQLLFQRTIPGFEPSPESYAHAVSALEGSRRRLSAIGVRKTAQVDLLTALLTGLVDQQVSNDPGGNRWVALIDDAVEMFLSHCLGVSGKLRTDVRRKRLVSQSYEKER
jgi:AcrR family transcriptional regulator